MLLVKRTQTEIDSRIKILHAIFNRGQVEYYPIEDLKGKIPETEFNKLNHDEWPILLGYSAYSLELLESLSQLNTKELQLELEKELTKWKVFKDSPLPVDIKILAKKGIVINRVFQSLHVLAWLLSDFEYGSFKESEIREILLDKKM